MEVSMRLVASLVLALACGAARGADFPSKPVRIIVPNPAGGTVDIVARTVAQSMAAVLGQPVVVDLKPGADTIIGTEAAARAPADGHTVVIVGTSFAFNPIVHKLPYDSAKDFAPVARLVKLPLVIAVHPAVPARSLGELVQLARQTPGSLDYASFATARLAGEMFKAHAGIELQAIPYQGGVQATAAVVGGHVKVLAGPLSDAIPHLNGGRLRALAVTSLERADAMKDVPTVAESGYPGFEFVNWMGILAPAATPRAVVERIAREARAALERPDARANLARIGVAPAFLEGPAFGEFVRAENRKYDALVRQSGFKLD
jgi:tripartite-type tricarboxylate transporter receptor subunit TctC